MKKVIFTLMAMLMLFTTFGCSDKNAEVKNLYEMEDVIMTDTMFKTDELKAFAPTVKRVAKPPMVPATIEAITYTSIGYQGSNQTKVFAYYGKPTTPMPIGGYPAVVLVHGGLGKAEYSWVEKWNKQGYAAIAMDIFSNMDTEEFMKIPNPDGGPIEANVGSFNNMNLPDEWTWTYQRVAGIMIANNILINDADINGEKVGLVGISWGAYLTCITSGIDKRFAFFAPIYGCGYLYEDATWINAGCSGSAMGAENFEKWKLKYDPSAYLPYSTKPMLFIGGMNRDEPFAPALRQKSADLVKGKVFYSLRESLTHSQESGDSQAEVYDFANHVLYGKDTALILSEVQIVNENATVNTSGKLKPAKAKLIYTITNTAEITNSHNWSFSAVDATVDSSIISGKVPSGATAYFFSVTDSNGARWSSKLMIK